MTCIVAADEWWRAVGAACITRLKRGLPIHGAPSREEVEAEVERAVTLIPAPTPKQVREVGGEVGSPRGWGVWITYAGQRMMLKNDGTLVKGDVYRDGAAVLALARALGAELVPEEPIMMPWSAEREDREQR